MGCLDVGQPPRYAHKVYGDDKDTELIPRSKWKPVTLRQWTPKVKDQDGIGACNAFATITAMESARNVAGLPYVQLSCGYLYGSINGGSDRGSMLEDALEHMTKVGSCPTSMVGDLSWRQSSWPAGVKEAAIPFRFLEYWWCPTFDHLASAAQKGFFLNLGIMWGNFRPDSDGWIAPSGGGGGHSILGCGLHERNGKWGLEMKNSWGQWGMNWDGSYGYAVLDENHFRGPVGGWWAVRSVVTEGGDIPAPVF